MSKNKKLPIVSSIEITSVPVVAHSRKLKAKWTVDKPGTLVSLVGEDLMRELDPLYDLKNLVKKAKRKYKNEPR